ncbi:MAG TPA: Hpt domain-containing protein [Alphaproteobacteria bacterium]|nr:Hpt domain-containing protein [Alphaproteobacteria bacterium]
MTLDAYHAQLAEIRGRFAARIAERVARLREIEGGLAHDDAARDEMHRTLHDIAGTAPSLGFEALGAEARRVEMMIAGAIKPARSFTADELAEIDSGLRLLAREAEQLHASAATNS